MPFGLSSPITALTWSMTRTLSKAKNKRCECYGILSDVGWTHFHTFRRRFMEPREKGNATPYYRFMAQDLNYVSGYTIESIRLLSSPSCPIVFDATIFGAVCKETGGTRGADLSEGGIGSKLSGIEVGK